MKQEENFNNKRGGNGKFQSYQKVMECGKKLNPHWQEKIIVRWGEGNHLRSVGRKRHFHSWWQLVGRKGNVKK